MPTKTARSSVAEEMCTFPGLGGNDDCFLGEDFTEGSRVRFTCPAGGRFTVMTGPADSSSPARCEFVLQE